MRGGGRRRRLGAGLIAGGLVLAGVVHGPMGPVGAGSGVTAGSSAAAARARAPRVVVTPVRPRPGDVVLVRVTGAPPDVSAEWAGRPLPLFRIRGGLAALVGIDLDTPPERIPWRLTRAARAGAPAVVRAGLVRVYPRAFTTQRLTLPPGQVDLGPETLARVKTEQAAFQAALADSVGERLWHGAFRVPVEGGHPTGGFGLRRIINGEPRSPHAGYDWGAPLGTPVLAANAGRVALVGEHFFAGRFVLLDHGLGLFTYYFHLEEARVAAGDHVAEGQAIGLVGATGRATGPHLHFGVTLTGARVDPQSLLALAPPPD